LITNNKKRNKKLIEKNNNDEGTRYVILNIEYVKLRNINNYVCDLIEKLNYVDGKPTISKIK
jgi:hypothetical protein